MQKCERFKNHGSRLIEELAKAKDFNEKDKRWGCRSAWLDLDLGYDSGSALWLVAFTLVPSTVTYRYHIVLTVRILLRYASNESSHPFKPKQVRSTAHSLSL